MPVINSTLKSPLFLQRSKEDLKKYFSGFQKSVQFITPKINVKSKAQRLSKINLNSRILALFKLKSF